MSYCKQKGPWPDMLSIAKQNPFIPTPYMFSLPTFQRPPPTAQTRRVKRFSLIRLFDWNPCTQVANAVSAVLKPESLSQRWGSVVTFKQHVNKSGPCSLHCSEWQTVMLAILIQLHSGYSSRYSQGLPGQGRIITVLHTSRLDRVSQYLFF